jgi:Fe(3+) dicitrate transport protein
LQADTPEGFLLQMKANNRAYEAKGIQHRGSIQLPSEWGQVVYGVRWHEDYADRFQWRDGYQLVDGEMQLTDAGAPGTAGNRIDRAQALASFVRGTIRTGKLTWTPGLRMENMEMGRTDWGSSDLDRVGSTPSVRTNPLTVWLPGLGLNYAISESAHIFSGVHKGFIPPGSNDETTAETSINAELGFRFDGGFWSGQAVAFNNIYQNLLGADLAATGGLGSGDLFNGGSARTQGFELEAACNAFAADSKWAMPIRLSYTYTNAQFTSAFESEYDPWDVVVDGDYMPYLSPHQLSLQVAMQNEKWSLETNTRYVAAMRTSAGQGSINLQEATDESIILDAVVRCELRPDLQWHVGMNNVFDSAFVVARRPAGIRAGMPRLLRTGLRFTF